MELYLLNTYMYLKFTAGFEVSLVLCTVLEPFIAFFTNIGFIPFREMNSHVRGNVPLVFIFISTVFVSTVVPPPFLWVRM